MRPKNGSIERVHFIELNAKAPTLGSLGAIFPKYGTTVLSTLLRDEGWDVRVFLEGVSVMSIDRMIDCDVVCMPVFAPAMTKVRKLAKEIRKRQPDLPIVMGGPHVCYFPETVVDICDYAVRCEGDEILPELLRRLAGDGEPRELDGISYIADDGAVINNPEPPPPAIPSTIPDLNLIEGFDGATQGILGDWNVINTLQTSRGCKYRCKFCPTRRLFGGSYRNRDVDAVIADIKKRREINRSFFVVDNDFCCDKKKARRLLERLIAEDLDVGFTIFERHEIGRDEEMLDLLHRAGVEVIIVGVESLLDESLASFDKKQKRDEVLRSIQSIRDHGIHVLSTFVIGGDADTPATADRLVRFINESGLSLNLFILHDLEEDPKKDLIIPLERRFRTYWSKHEGNDSYFDYASGSFASYFPKRMKPSTLQRSVLKINAEVFSHPNILRNVLAREINQSLFSVVFGYGMRAINDAVGEVLDDGFMDYLREIERGLYDEDEVLIEERLAKLESLPLPPPMKTVEPPRTYDTLALLGSLPGLARFYAPRLGAEVTTRASRLLRRPRSVRL